MNKTSLITIVNPDSAGIDIGASSHFVAVPSGRDLETVKEFGCYRVQFKVLVGLPSLPLGGKRTTRMQ